MQRIALVMKNKETTQSLLVSQHVGGSLLSLRITRCNSAVSCGVIVAVKQRTTWEPVVQPINCWSVLMMVQADVSRLTAFYFSVLRDDIC